MIGAAVFCDGIYVALRWRLEWVYCALPASHFQDPPTPLLPFRHYFSLCISITTPPPSFPS